MNRQKESIRHLLYRHGLAAAEAAAHIAGRGIRGGVRQPLALPFCFVLVMLTACNAQIAPTGGSAKPLSAPANLINGVYAYNSSNYQQMLSNSNVDGIVVYFPWSTVEPSDGGFDWTSVDAAVQAAQNASKKIAIAITPGWATPSWVYTDGAKSFTFLWDLNYRFPYCTPIQIPIPWDSVYLAKWTALIQAFGQKYDQIAAVSHIEASGISSKTMETFLPWQSSESINNGQCQAPNYVTQWQQAGYTRVLIENAWAQIAAAFEQAFPDKPWGPVIPGGVFPPIDDNGNIIQGQTQDTVAPQEILNLGVTTYPSQFVGQNNALQCNSSSECWISPMITAVSSQVATGYQTVAPLGENLQPAVNLLLQNNGKFIEIYASDISSSDPVVQAAVAYAHQQLTGQ